MKVGDLLIKIMVDGKTGEVNIKDFGGVVDKVSDQVVHDTKRMGSAFDRVANFAQKTFFTISSFRMLVAPLKQMIDLAGEQERSEKKVEQAVISTGAAAGRTTEQLKAMASELQGETTFGDEEILNKVTAQLLTFTNITEERFDRTQQAALDLATVLDGDLQGASIMLGKALNDPVSNLGALSRAGIQFSEDQGKVIKQMAKTGDMAGAQTIILDELAKQYGGQAAAAAETGAGAIKQFANVLGDVQEVGGRVLQTFLLPLMEQAVPILSFLSTLDQGTATFLVTVIGLAAAMWKVVPAIRGISTATKILGISVKTALGPISWIIAALGLLWSAWANNLFGLQDITVKVWGYIKAAFVGAWEFIKSFGARIGQFWSSVAKLIGAVFSDDPVKNAKEAMKGMKDAVVGGWGDTFDKVAAQSAKSLEDHKKKQAEKVSTEQSTQDQIVDINKKGDEQKAEIDKKALERAKLLSELRIANIQDEQTRKLAEVEAWFAEESAKYAGQNDILAELEIQKNNRMAEINKDFSDKNKAEQEKIAKEALDADIALQDIRVSNIQNEHERKIAEAELYYQRLFEKHAGNADMLAELEIQKNNKLAEINAQYRSQQEINNEKLIAVMQDHTEQFLTSFLQGNKITVDSLKDLWTSFKNRFIENLVSMAMESNSFSNILSSIFDFLPGGKLISTGVKALGKVFGFASGGRVNRPTAAIVGEAGAEILAPERDYIQVMNDMVAAGMIKMLTAPPPLAAPSQSFGNTELVDAIRGMTFKFYVNQRELAEAVNDGQLELNAAVI